MTTGSRSERREVLQEVAPKLHEVVTGLVMEDIWERSELSKRDRSLITVAALLCGGHTDHLKTHILRALDHGVTKTELAEVFTHLAFYAGFPAATEAVYAVNSVYTATVPPAVD